MASLCLVTPRDRDLFAALDRGPLTVRQLLTLSVTFAYPFTTERRVQERLQKLCAAGRVRPPEGPAFAFFLELDNSTESVRSQTNLDSWQRKVRFYERIQDAQAERF